MIKLSRPLTYAERVRSTFLRMLEESESDRIARRLAARQTQTFLTLGAPTPVPAPANIWADLRAMADICRSRGERSR